MNAFAIEQVNPVTGSGRFLPFQFATLEEAEAMARGLTESNPGFLFRVAECVPA